MGLAGARLDLANAQRTGWGRVQTRCHLERAWGRLPRGGKTVGYAFKAIRSPGPAMTDDAEICRQEEEWLLKVVIRALGRGPEPRIVAAVVLVDLPQLPTLYRHTPRVLFFPRGDDLRGAIDRLAADIQPEFADPDRIDPERVVKAALRALDTDVSFVESLYRG